MRGGSYCLFIIILSEKVVTVFIIISWGLDESFYILVVNNTNRVVKNRHLLYSMLQLLSEVEVISNVKNVSI